MNPSQNEIIIFCYYFPGFHPCPTIYVGQEAGFCEWDLMINARRYFPGHYQPRIPLWGYEIETSRSVIENKLKTAKTYGIQSIVFIEYWYNGRNCCSEPLSVALETASTKDCALPSMMWANHNRYWCYPEKGDEESQIYLRINYSWVNCKKMIDYWISNYFSHPNYYKLPDGRLFFSIYSPQSIVNATGSKQTLKDIIDYIRSELSNLRLPPIHIHACETRFIEDMEILVLGFDSCSDYLSIGYSENARHKEPHIPVTSLHGHLVADIPLADRLENILLVYRTLGQLSPIIYYPVITVGRDCSPRIGCFTEIRRGHYSARPIVREFSPEVFERCCRIAKKFLEESCGNPKLLFINSWNEWTEGAYLEPDTVYKYGFLQVVKDTLAPERDDKVRTEWKDVQIHR